MFEEAFASQLEKIDLGTVLMNMVDTCPADALPFLAVQFNVEGYKGMRFCQTEEEKRDLIKRAVDLHRYKGTRWAVAESLKVLGYNDVEVDDHIAGFYYDGTNEHDATIYYSSPHWAMFRVIIYISDSFSWTSDLYPDVVALVNEYKNTRSHLLDISAGLRINDSQSCADEIQDIEYGYIVSDNLNGLQYNASATHNGFYQYNGDDSSIDELTITITP